jgi:hypothetical protein
LLAHRLIDGIEDVTLRDEHLIQGDARYFTALQGRSHHQKQPRAIKCRTFLSYYLSNENNVSRVELHGGIFADLVA